jgi:Cys-rich protein (TIGR01571 family)
LERCPNSISNLRFHLNKMDSNGNENLKTEIQQAEPTTLDNVPKATGINTLSNSGVSRQGKQRSGFRNFFSCLSSGARLKKPDPSPSFKFQQPPLERDEFSRSIHSENHGSHEHFQFIRKINWGYLWEMCKNWIREPMNMALFVWIACVAVSGAILFLVMTGMLNHALPKKSQRDAWFEVNNQILNALFTLMCLYQHPKRIYNFVLLCRWEQKDILRLRKEYCKNGAYKPNEWMHMMVVVILLNLNCFAQYALCVLNLGYRRSERPPIGVGLTISVAIGAAAFAGLYNIMSPLGKDYDSERTDIDQEAQIEVTSTESGKTTSQFMSFERRRSFIQSEEHRFVESRPEWVGGLMDFWDQIYLAYLSIFCSCCVSGWNMQRLGFGNMYVHIATFLLFCLAPFFIFNLAAVNINNENLREALGLTGIFLCFFGLLYGGFWRIQMRKRFNLPENNFCCHNPNATDCFQWLFCCSCSLAQEVRTADYYDIAEEGQRIMSPLPREDGLPLFKSTPGSPYRSGTASPSIFIMESPSAPRRSSGSTPHVGSPTTGHRAMKAPTPSVVNRDTDSGL